MTDIQNYFICIRIQQQIAINCLLKGVYKNVLLALRVSRDISVYTATRLCPWWRRTFWARAVIKMMWCDTCDFFERQQLPVVFVAIQLIIQMHI